MATILEQVQQAQAAVAGAGSGLDDELRKKSLVAARDLVAALERPHETIMHFAYHLGPQRMALRMAIDLGIYRALSAAGQPLTATQLAVECKSEKLLLVRLMRVLNTIRFIAEVGHETYAANQMTHAMARPESEHAVTTCYDLPARIQVRLHDYFKEKGYASPTDSADCPMQWALETKQGYFDYILSDPARLAAFNSLMTRIRGTRKHWTEWYPVEEKILQAAQADPEPMLLIDMGGARGHDLETFLAKFPQAHGRLLLQDLPSTINTLENLRDGVKAMSHDFFTPQPVQGARAYYFHFVFHDWPDETCRTILRQIIPAMKPGYSKILLNEAVLPDRNCPAEFAAADINMMSILAGRERTRQDWIELVESAGLQVVEVCSSPYEEDEEGIVEAVLPG